MAPMQAIRTNVFWFMDVLKGSTIRKHFENIALIQNGLEHGEVARLRHRALAGLLHHAVSTVPFYSNKTGFTSLSEFRVINKSVVRESFNEFFSSSFARSELNAVATSGSTGTPFKAFQNKNKKERNSADVLFFSQAAGYELGDRLVYVKAYVRRKAAIRYWMENTIPVEVFELNDVSIGNLIRVMESTQVRTSIVGYSSSLEVIARYLDKCGHGKVRANVRAIIGIAEALSSYAKEALHRHFEAPVMSRYSNIELGIMAQQEPNGSERYRVNTASYFVEILKMDSDEQAGPGEAGRIVVTDLYNYGMPFIRYDTGDIGTIWRDPDSPGKVFLENLHGRRVDLLYDTKGNIVSSPWILAHMSLYSGIKQYQLVQEGAREYILRINPDCAFTGEREAIGELRNLFGQDAAIRVEYVSEIPLLSSGKRKVLINQTTHCM